MRGQLFTMDFLVSALAITVALGLFLHSVEFPLRLSPSAADSTPVMSQALLASYRVLPLNKSLITQGGDCVGKAFCHPLDAVANRFFDSGADRFASVSIVLEDGRPLGPAHSSFVDIQSLGGGGYSDWLDSSTGKNYLAFSSSDGSSPALNGFSYSLMFATIPAGLVSRNFCTVIVSGGKGVADGCSAVSCSTRTSVERYFKCGKSACTLIIEACSG